MGVSLMIPGRKIHFFFSSGEYDTVMESHTEMCLRISAALTLKRQLLKCVLCAGARIKLCFLSCPNPQILYISDPS